MSPDDGRSLTVQEIVVDWLKSHGYDGLYSDSGECACLAEDLAPCGEIGNLCRAGVLGKCNPENCANGGGCTWHIVDRGHGDQMTEEERSAFLAQRKK